MIGHRVFAAAFVLCALVIGSAAGCNQLLGNEEGRPYPDAGAVLDAAGDAGAPTSSDGGSGGNGAVACDTSSGHKLCFGLCVATNDPSFGCGGASCVACDPKNVFAAACQGGDTGPTCGYDATKGCTPGFADCNGDAADGCEASLNDPNSCGSCQTRCGDTNAPLCAAGGGTYGCVTTCPDMPSSVGMMKECSGACVDVQSDVNNCGDCGSKCERPNASALCGNGSCVYSCISGTHPCDETCVSNGDPATCGASCTPCAQGGPHTHAICLAGGCSVACAQGYVDCNRDYLSPSGDGCEVAGDSCGWIDCGTVQCGPGQCCKSSGVCGVVVSGILCQ
jgi:hypothetical protein